MASFLVVFALGRHAPGPMRCGGSCRYQAVSSRFCASLKASGAPLSPPFAATRHPGHCDPTCRQNAEASAGIGHHRPRDHIVKRKWEHPRQRALDALSDWVARQPPQPVATCDKATHGVGSHPPSTSCGFADQMPDSPSPAIILNSSALRELHERAVGCDFVFYTALMGAYDDFAKFASSQAHSLPSASPPATTCRFVFVDLVALRAVQRPLALWPSLLRDDPRFAVLFRRRIDASEAIGQLIDYVRASSVVGAPV